jgi:asparagine synthase (glutamine-hydrolysing)
MCGIIVLIGTDINEKAKKALHKINHRGLDANKIIIEENIALGFNRLAINDKSKKAMQPFEFENLIGVFNGEIYNSKEIRSEFDITTNSSSDMEVVLPLFKKFGSSLIHYLDGFYSGIIFNKSTKQLFVLRDYIGKKPLFYGKSKDFEFITSELKAIDFIDTFQFVPKGFSELNNSTINVIEKHRLQYQTKYELRQLLISAVEKRIPKEEKMFGVFLSGGLDSSIITKIVSSLSQSVIYYTLADSNSSDLQFVNILTKSLNIEQHLRIIGLPNLDEIPELIIRLYILQKALILQ